MRIVYQYMKNESVSTSKLKKLKNRDFKKLTFLGKVYVLKWPYNGQRLTDCNKFGLKWKKIVCSIRLV